MSTIVDIRRLKVNLRSALYIIMQKATVLNTLGGPQKHSG